MSVKNSSAKNVRVWNEVFISLVGATNCKAKFDGKGWSWGCHVEATQAYTQKSFNIRRVELSLVIILDEPIFQLLSSEKLADWEDQKKRLIIFENCELLFQDMETGSSKCWLENLAVLHDYDLNEIEEIIYQGHSLINQVFQLTIPSVYIKRYKSSSNKSLD